MNENGTPEHYPLDGESIELIADYQKQIMALDSRIGGVLDIFVKKSKLTGQWNLHYNMREIVRKEVGPVSISRERETET